MNFLQHRPRGYTGLGDSRLPRIIETLAQLLIKAQNRLAYDTLFLPDQEFFKLAHVLVEFAEDLHHHLGIWQSLERYNLDLFGTPLPLILPANRPIPQTPSMEDRLHHLLWALYAEIYPDLILAPAHRDLQRLAAIAAEFLTKKFARMRQQSGIKQFLTHRDKYGWDVKRKLVWLGQHSYLFRYNFWNYIENQGGKADIPTIDDFICQETTAWSGLGVIDILAGILPLTEDQRATLRHWYERHAAYYLVVERRSNHLKLLNLINDATYKVRIDGSDVFSEEQVVFGSLLPWAGEWYWSGEQRLLGSVPETVRQELRERLLRTASQIVYRYDKQHLAVAQETVERMHQHFLNYHGDNLVIYPDGLSMAADIQKMYRLYNESLPDPVKSKAMAEHELTTPKPSMPYPPEIIENENGVALFSNPGEGTELMVDFNEVINGLKKRGDDLSEDEADTIRGFIQSEAISPQFVERVVSEYGRESIGAAFLIRDREDPSYFDYLLRRYKGHFYRNRYPSVTIV